MLTLLRVLALVGSWNAVLGGGYEPDRAVSVAANAGTRLEINRVSAEDLDLRQHVLDHVLDDRPLVITGVLAKSDLSRLQTTPLWDRTEVPLWFMRLLEKWPLVDQGFSWAKHSNNKATPAFGCRYHEAVCVIYWWSIQHIGDGSISHVDSICVPSWSVQVCKTNSPACTHLPRSA